MPLIGVLWPYVPPTPPGPSFATGPGSYTFTTDFTTPAAPANLVITSAADLIALDATITASADTYHYEYLWEAQTGDGVWTEVGRTTGNEFVYYLTPLNHLVRLRVSDSNGSLYSTPTEGSGTLTFQLWGLTSTDGDESIIQPIRWVQEGVSTDTALDQVVVQPLSGPDGDTQLPIVFTGQWQGEHVDLSVIIRSDDSGLLRAVKRAARMPAGTIGVKSPDGDVYIVTFGSMRLTRQDGFISAGLSAIRVA